MQRPFIHPASDEIRLEGVLFALADPVRLSIVRKLAAENCPMNCSAAAPVDLPKSTQSHHYQVLRENGLIWSERKGTAVINTLRCEELEARFPGVVSAVLKAAEAESGDSENESESV
jgi:DNA-binding transcriptional ArsR family regulator